MREIKFRGKDYNYNWRFGDLVQEKWGQGKAVSIKKNNYQWGILEETIGQYTGLKDKNGTEIYEGDIVKYNAYWEDDFDYSAGKGIIIWDEEEAQFLLKNKYGNNPFIEMFNLVKNLGAEVLGNIYENSDLLKEE